MGVVERTTTQQSQTTEGLEVHFPAAQTGTLDQDEEWCTVAVNGSRRKIRFHDYDEVFEVPGLYEHLFYEKLKCNSPETVCTLLEEELAESDDSVSDLTVLDVGAGNGMVGEELVNRGAESVVGIDIIEAARDAARRDRPGIYEDYFVADLTDLPRHVARQLDDAQFNCLTSVAALGYGDIPPAAFARAFNLISTPGWVAFNIKEDFLKDTDTTGFAGFMRRMIDSGILKVRLMRRYRHRLSLVGEPLYYLGIVGRKQRDVPESWLEDVREAAG